MRKSEIDDLLSTMLESHDNVSDLNVTVDRPLQVEASGELVSVPVDPTIDNLTPFQTEIFALNIINGDRRLTEHLIATGSCDTSYYLPGKARFRVNIFSQRSNMSIVLRKLETNIPTIESLKLPDAFKKMPAEKNGLILITGATGSGKTTSLAALLNEINATKSLHIVTLEDPVEYVHPNRKATFNQRELGLDYDTFANGLRAALRQARIWWCLVVVLLALWKGRRIGPLVAEQLPVVVRASETVEGRGRLYRSRRAHDRAAEALRTAALQRMMPRIGLGHDAEPPAVVMAVAERCGLSPQAVAHLLFGPPPANDSDLVNLARELDNIERQVAQS